MTDDLMTPMRVMREAGRLLAALEALTECYCEVGGATLSRADRQRHRGVYVEALAAIAAAKGETPDTLGDGTEANPCSRDACWLHEKCIGLCNDSAFTVTPPVFVRTVVTSAKATVSVTPPKAEALPAGLVPRMGTSSAALDFDDYHGRIGHQEC